MNDTTLAEAAWRTSTYSTSGNQCVEIAPLPGGEVAVRDSKNRAGGIHVFTQAEWGAFIAGVKSGEFDFGDGAP